MASYLTTASSGEFDIHAYTANGIRFWDSVDPDLNVPVQPHSGSQYAISQQSEPSYKRLQRAIAVPAGGATLTFWVNRDTEGGWDHVFVEAHTAGMDNWTTLPDANSHIRRTPGSSARSRSRAATRSWRTTSRRTTRQLRSTGTTGA
jgi:hypothetical protein